ncbi:MAG: glycosyltransferase [Thaumarchaeota archaeon]|nr:glycosyltransferase [Nitrososphaerota archaeon]
MFSGRMNYPPDIHNMKNYYVSEEMKRRGLTVNWVQLGGPKKRWNKDGIQFAVLRAPRGGHLPEALQALPLALYCATRRIQVVYEDEWLFLRKKPWARLACQMILRGFGVKLVLDQRDPYVDFEIAAGELNEGTKIHRRLSLIRSLLLRQTDLIILPSEAYSELYISEGIPEKKVLGIFRGIDPEVFKPQVKPNDAKSKLGLEGRFVIGWFGLMHSYRMIKEIIVPLIENLAREIPNAHFLIGGEGPLLGEFDRLRSTEAGNSFTMLGTIPYTKLPDYIAASDVTICPVSTKFRFSTHSNWLKIAESVAVGTPIIATKTEISKLDYSHLKGVVWVDSDYQSFLSALKNVQKDHGLLHSEAEDQARHFEAFSIESRIPRIVDRVLALVHAK